MLELILILADASMVDTWIHAAMFMEDCSKETLQTIINHGADINATNKNNDNSINDSL